jgi:hypothetical protein
MAVLIIYKNEKGLSFKNDVIIEIITNDNKAIDYKINKCS